jgi:hypothetical protein
MYVYRSLPQPGFIRLLRRRPASRGDADIQCQLFDYQLLHNGFEGTDLYEALSYAWGSTSNQAMEDIRLASAEHLSGSFLDETRREAIVTLLQRTWFERMWVCKQSKLDVSFGYR